MAPTLDEIRKKFKPRSAQEIAAEQREAEIDTVAADLRREIEAGLLDIEVVDPGRRLMEVDRPTGRFGVGLMVRLHRRTRRGDEVEQIVEGTSTWEAAIRVAMEIERRRVVQEGRQRINWPNQPPQHFNNRATIVEAPAEDVAAASLRAALVGGMPLTAAEAEDLVRRSTVVPKGSKSARKIRMAVPFFPAESFGAEEAPVRKYLAELRRAAIAGRASVAVEQKPEPCVRWSLPDKDALGITGVLHPFDPESDLGQAILETWDAIQEKGLTILHQPPRDGGGSPGLTDLERRYLRSVEVAITKGTLRIVRFDDPGRTVVQQAGREHVFEDDTPLARRLRIAWADREA